MYWFRTHTEQDYAFSYGAYSYLGNYNVQAVTDLKGRKPYFGGGISGDMCINIDLPMLVFRIIGIKGSLFYEDGSYHNFKKQVVLYSLGIANADKFGTNISSYSAIDVKLKKVA